MLNELLQDIEIGMKQGYEDYDACGEKVTIFLDLVGCVGDTPAMNGVLDIKGHNAIACCHLCRFRRVQSEDVEIGKGKQVMKLCNPRYMGTYPHGGITSASRSNEVHSTMQALELRPETAKRLGINIGESSPFLQYSKVFQSISNQIPITASNVPVVPSCLDAYRCMIIGPDHLIFGLAKNSINAVLSLLPSSGYIQAYENIAIHYLHAARVATPKRVVNHEEKKLFSITISQVFALLVISEESFRLGVLVAEKDLPADANGQISSACNAAINIVGSLSRVASRIWFRPRLEEDGVKAAQEYNDAHGAAYLRDTQQMIEDHLQLMRKSCSYNREEIREYKSLLSKKSSSAKSRRKILERDLRERSLLCKALDTPNVHRMLEFAHTYLPMIGGGIRISELEFEKGHQALKRAVEKSNNRNSHLQAMSSAISNDWQGRLSMLLDGKNNQSYECELSLFRLLTGRECVAARNGKISQEDRAAVRDSMGPGDLVQQLLRMQGRKVFNDVVPFIGYNYWEGVSIGDRKRDYESFPLSGISPFQFEIEENRESKELEAEYESFINTGINLLNNFYGSDNWYHVERVQPRHHHSGSKKKFSEVVPGDVMQCLVFDQNEYSPFITPHLSDSEHHKTSLGYFYVIYLFVADSKCCAVVLPCIKDECNVSDADETNRSTSEESNDSTDRYERDSLNVQNLTPMRVDRRLENLKIMRLASSCQRVYIQHRCTGPCLLTQSTKNKLVVHNQHPIDSQFYIRNRMTGFPPRAA